MKMNNSDNELILFRLDKIETKLSDKVELCSEMLIKITTKLEAGAFQTMNCPIHANRITNVETSQKEMNVEMDKLKSWKYKVAGALLVITFILNLFASPIIARLFDGANQDELIIMDGK